MLLSPSFVLEEKPAYTDHDRLFKEVIQTFFKEFIELFLPKEFVYLDFTDVRFLAQEVFTDILSGEKRKVDILAEVKYKDVDTLILIHVEPQSYYQKEFHERMFIYCSRLYENHRKPVLPIAVFSYPDKREVPSQFSIALPTFEIVNFNYLQIHLVKMDWRAFIQSDNPVAAAFLSKMGYTKKEKVRVKLEFLRILSRMEMNPAKAELIYGFFETYLILNEAEETEMREEIERLPEEEASQILKLPNSYYERGIERGIEQGIEQGIEKGIEKGIEQGIEKAVMGMVKKKISKELISEVTGMSTEKIEELEKLLND